MVSPTPNASDFPSSRGRYGGPAIGGGPAEWVALHDNVHLRPVEERHLGPLERISTEPALSEPSEWHGYRNPTTQRRRWEEDRYLGQ